MFIPEKEFLFLFGWDGFFENQLTESSHSMPTQSELHPARVICEEKNLYRVQITKDETRWATVSGKLIYQAHRRTDYPAVGDWVMVDVSPGADRALIHRVLDRKSMIQRKQVGSSADVQVLAANVDFVFITTSVDHDLNVRRLERYMSLAWDSKAVPIILLTKADTQQSGTHAIEHEMMAKFPGVAVHSTSNDRFHEATFFSEYLRAGKTAVVVGSSGVGKSTLVNYLIGEEKIKTQGVRESDSKGRHTTTSRSMYQTRYNGLIIDTPGMRELQLADQLEGVQAQFADIEELAGECRFTDCNHETEPGCKIKEAIANSELDPERWLSYRKLEAEARHAARKQSKVMASQQKKEWKKKAVEAYEKGRAKRGPTF